MLVEGELDALTVLHAAGDLVTPVALGSTNGARQWRWIDALVACSLVLVARDADPDPCKGDRAAAWWLDLLPHARRLRPWWADANQMYQDGADVRGWIATALEDRVSSCRLQPASNDLPLETRSLQLDPPCSIEDWPDFRARQGGLPGARLAWPEGERGLVAILQTSGPPTCPGECAR